MLPLGHTDLGDLHCHPGHGAVQARAATEGRESISGSQGLSQCQGPLSSLRAMWRTGVWSATLDHISVRDLAAPRAILIGWPVLPYGAMETSGHMPLPRAMSGPHRAWDLGWCPWLQLPQVWPATGTC